MFYFEQFSASFSGKFLFVSGWFLIFIIFFFSISVICASQNSVRDIMLGAQQIGVLNTGQYVFINLGKYNSH